MEYENRPTSPSSDQEPTGPSGTDAAVGSKEPITDKATGVRSKVTDFGRRAADKLDDSRASVARALDHTASTLHSGGDKVSGATHAAADKVQATADYVRRTGLEGMADSVGNVVKRYPAQALAVAAILGFLAARTLRRQED